MKIIAFVLYILSILIVTIIFYGLYVGRGKLYKNYILGLKEQIEELKGNWEYKNGPMDGKCVKCGLYTVGDKNESTSCSCKGE